MPEGDRSSQVTDIKVEASMSCFLAIENNSQTVPYDSAASDSQNWCIQPWKRFILALFVCTITHSMNCLGIGALNIPGHIRTVSTWEHA